MAVHQGMAWSMRPVRGEITAYAGIKYEKIQDVDTSGNPLFDESGEPVWLEGDGIPTQDFKKTKVIFYIDVPDFISANRIRQVALFLQTAKSDHDLKLSIIQTAIMTAYSTLQEHSKEYYSMMSAISSRKGDPEATSEERLKDMEDERKILSKLKGLADDAIDMPAEFEKMKKLSRDNEPILNDALSLVVPYIRSIKVDVGDGGVGHDFLFQKLVKKGSEHAPLSESMVRWEDLDKVERFENAKRCVNDLLPPVLEAIAQGATAEEVKK